MDPSQEAVIAELFSRKEHLYALLWWTDPDSNVVNARSFVINGRDSIPVFTSKAEAMAQVAGSGYENDVIGIEPGLLAEILLTHGYAIINPGGPNPIQFTTCILKPYAKGGRVHHRTSQPSGEQE